MAACDRRSSAAWAPSGSFSRPTTSGAASRRGTGAASWPRHGSTRQRLRAP
jgi:hypothetical protein